VGCESNRVPPQGLVGHRPHFVLHQAGANIRQGARCRECLNVTIPVLFRMVSSMYSNEHGGCGFHERHVIPMVSSQDDGGEPQKLFQAARESSSNSIRNLCYVGTPWASFKNKRFRSNDPSATRRNRQAIVASCTQCHVLALQLIPFRLENLNPPSLPRNGNLSFCSPTVS
jgi:hypothetical protein